jgi:hypothetical protein
MLTNQEQIMILTWSKVPWVPETSRTEIEESILEKACGNMCSRPVRKAGAYP